ncbi:MAG TPA: SDR family NAD(P)-dependent oxidoreductase [Methylomirabilota bacterium]|jgi:NAD(P)-dependent dehydrogenase (short-subunit alcohol dehydrogenase family)|nr:SDR family NAD(P)-dependent oxidoreductase [Methylomirabilota bacterium]
MAATELAGRVALVTGGGGGLGAALCRTLGEAGAVVVAADVRLEAAENVADQVRAAGGKAVAACVDVTDEGSAAHSVRESVAQFGALDILVNNAGTDLTVPFESLTPADWDRILGVNLRGPFLMSRAAFSAMRERGRGHIVNIVSTAAKRAWANAAAYHASKWGLLGLSHALHVEGRAHGVKVTAVIAGGMRTPFLLDRFPELDPAVLQDPMHVARAVRFVLSQPDETVVPEITVLPMRETSWP